MTMDFAASIVLLYGAAATISDVYWRRVPRWLSLPVFLLGLAVSGKPYISLLSTLKTDMTGVAFIVTMLWNWLGPSLISLAYALFLFWLGLWGGGDGQFLIAITPWCGLFQTWKIILYFYPVACVYLAIYLLIRHRFKIGKIIKHQGEDTIRFIKAIGMRNGEDSEIERHGLPGMVALYASVILSYLL